MACKIGLTNCNAKIALLRASMVVTYYTKLFRTGADRHNSILMSLLFLVAETINAVNEILKHQCNNNGFVFIFQDYGWTFTNGSLNCSLFYKDLLQLIEQGNVKLAMSIPLTISSRHNHSNVNVVSVHLSRVYGSKPVYSSNATKRKVCNTSSTSQINKPLNNNKHVWLRLSSYNGLSHFWKSWKLVLINEKLPFLICNFHMIWCMWFDDKIITVFC